MQVVAVMCVTYESVVAVKLKADRLITDARLSPSS